jgi:ABC-type lipoprotein export system ATPase subunit
VGNPNKVELANVAIAAITTRGLGRIFGSPHGDIVALADLDLEVFPGEVVVLMGRSGTGKTTALNILCGLDTPTAGEAVTLGVSVIPSHRKDLAVLRRFRVGRVFQDSDLLDELDALDNVALAVELRTGASGARAREIARSVIEELGIGDRAHSRPIELSGGEKQRVAIARAMASGVDVILADEPTGSLDEGNAIVVAEALRRAAESGAAVLVATHDSVIAERADRIVRTDTR